MNFAAPRGMRDFYPEEMQIRNTIFSAWKDAARLYGFEEYDAPVVETEELLIRKGGEEIVQQIYAFEDKSGRRLALRPEMTPSLARMVIARQKMLTFPLKWFCIAQCFRYERMTKGRKREHFQWNLDVVGEESLLAEAEVLGAAITALRYLGLTPQDFRVRIGSRMILAELFKVIGLDAAHFLSVCLVLDKMGKITEPEMANMLQQEGLNTTEIDKVFGLMSLTSLDLIESKFQISTPSVAVIRNLFAHLQPAGLADFLEFDLSIIRGLSYYTGIVFEAFDTQRKFRALFGGGRYDNLLRALGGEAMPCVGLGFGDVVIQELLADLGKLTTAPQNPRISLGYMTDDQRPLALEVTTLLRQQGIPVDLALIAEKPRKFFSRTDKIGASFTLFLGPDEVAQQVMAVKNMQTGAVQTLSYATLCRGEFTSETLMQGPS
ncbi:histidine--tRNA ligase [candidate division KSB1 bacterium]|nr:histidine--tRNA ligase [candidate division KSB1 bacterium]